MLKLVTVQPITTTIPAIVQPVTLNNLLFVFPEVLKKGTHTLKEQQEQIEAIRKDLSIQSLVPGLSLDTLDKDALVSKTIEKLTFVAENLAVHEGFGKKQIPSYLKSLKSVLYIMTKDDLMKLYNRVQAMNVPTETKETIRTLFLETAKMSGTSPVVMFFKEMIETEQLSQTETFMVLATLAHDIKTPTAELIDEVFELIKCPVVVNNELLKIHAHLVFATIVNKACINTPVNQVFPEATFGKMCAPDNVKITQVYIPYLVKALKETAPGSMHQSGALSVLAILGHESVLPLVIDYIEGRVEGTSLGGRKMAIYSLADIAKKHRNLLMPVFASLVHNPAEERGVRIAALSMMMSLQPTALQLQKLAVSTWYEKDAEVHKFIYFSLRTLAHLGLEHHPEDSQWKDLTIKAQIVLPLAKPIAGIISSTFNSYISEVLPNLHVGTQFFTAFVSEKSGHLLYHRIEHFLKQAQTTPLEFSIDVRGLKALSHELMTMFTGQETNFLEKIHPEWKNIVQGLEVAPHGFGNFEADFWARISDDIQFILGGNMNIVKLVKEKVEQHMREPAKIMEKVCAKTPININKAFEFMPYAAYIPSDLGLPIIVESQVTTLVSIKGSIDVNCGDLSVSVNTAQKAAYTYEGSVGTICPFTGEFVAAGINQHRATNVPVNAVMEVVPNKHAVKITMK